MIKQLKFELHHIVQKTEQEESKFFLTKWLDKTKESLIPPYSTHYVGMGGFVMNSKEEVLVIKQKVGVGATDWRLPGGTVQANQRLVDAALRQLYQETGVVGKFVGIIGGRQVANYRFKRPDIYLIALIQLDETIQGNGDLEMQQKEIEDAKWVHISKLFQQGFTKSYVMNSIIDFIKDTLDDKFEQANQNECQYQNSFNILKRNSLMGKPSQHLSENGQFYPSYVWFPARETKEVKKIID